ncbi:MAG: hypothetical protein ACJ8C4_03220 [Gemmataceae bacterium]
MKQLTRPTLFILALVLVLSSSAKAEDALRKELAEVAKSIKSVLDEEKRTDIAVGEFTGPPQIDSQFGPGIQKVLTEELEKAKVSVNKKSELSVSGNYADDAAPAFGDKQLVVKINARILARNGDEKHRLSTRVIKDNTTIAKMAAVTTSLKPKADAQTRNEEIKQAIEHPSVHIAGTKVSAKETSPFGVEILVRKGPGSPAVVRQPKSEGGQAFVNILKDEIYEIRIHNKAKFEAAITVTIDGVDVFAFSEDKKPDGTPRFTHYFIDPNTAADITGWQVSNDSKRSDNLLSFLVTELGKGAASKMGVTGKTGVITVTFAAATSGNRPTDLPEDDGGRSATNVETGFGPPQKQQIEEVKRTIGAVREVISIRYAH